MSRWAFLVTLVTLVAASVAHAQSDDGDPVARAESYALAAYEAYARGDYGTAVELYRSALDASPSADILYNLARIYDTKLKDREQALKYYDHFTRDPDADPSRRQIALERVLTLRELERGSVPTATTRARPAAVSDDTASGSVRNEATGEGGSGMATTGWVLGAVGVAGLLGGTGLGVAAKSDADVAHAECNGNACTTQRGVDAAERGGEWATASTIAFVAGGALLATGAVLILFSPSRRERASRAQLTPWAGQRGFGVHLSSAF